MKHQKTLEKLGRKKTLFKMYRHEMEATMRLNVEGDIARLRGFKDGLGIAIGDLKLQLDGLREELAYLKSSHEEVGIGGIHGNHCHNQNTLRNSNIRHSQADRFCSGLARNGSTCWFEVVLSTFCRRCAWRGLRCREM